MALKFLLSSGLVFAFFISVAWGAHLNGDIPVRRLCHLIAGVSYIGFFLSALWWIWS